MPARWWRRLRGLLQRDRLEREMEEELRFHVEELEAQGLREGLRPEQAREQALRRFGRIDQLKEECRDSRGRFVEMLLQDVRFGLRSLRRSPAFTLAAVVTLGLGIGANTAVFSVVNSVLLRPLPFARGHEVVLLQQRDPRSGSPDLGFSPPELADYAEQAKTLEAVAEYHSMSFTLFGGQEPQQVRTGVVSAHFFELLGVRPLLGRTFLPGEDRQGAEPVLVLAYDYWRRQGADPGIVGRRFEMNDRVHTVVGVLPALPEYPDDNDVFMPASACPFRSAPGTQSNRQARLLTLFGRVKPGTPLATVQAELLGISDRLRAAHPDAHEAGSLARAQASPLQEELVRRARPTFLLLLATVALVLLIACANVANLSLARLAERNRELSLRAALGAGRGRLLRQLVTESTLLALAGGALGLLVAAGAQGALASFAGRFTPRAAEIHIDSAVLLFALVASLLTGVLAGTLPGLPNADRLAPSLLGENGRSSAGRARQRLRSGLVVWQVALSFMLLIGAALMLRSYAKLQRVDAGFRGDNVLTLSLNLNFSKYQQVDQDQNPQAQRERLLGFYRGFETRAARLPGVVDVASAYTFPLNSAFRNRGSFLIQGRGQDGSAPPVASYLGVSSSYFRALGVPVLAGRAFEERDQSTATDALVINRSLANRHFAGVDPLLQRISVDNGKTWRSVVGVVGDVRQAVLEREPDDAIYVPLGQFPGYGVSAFVRSVGDPLVLADRVRGIAHAIDPDTAVNGVRTLLQIREESLSSPRLTTLLLALFAALALTISATGLSGLIAYSVAQRTQEIGIRMALGADPGGVLLLVMRQGLVSVGIGLGVGLLGALALSGLVSSLLFGVAATDPLCFVGSAAVLLAVAVAACLLPARRAVGLPLTLALRTE